MEEDKSSKFRRLASRRGERILKDIRLLANLSNSKNYSYTDIEVKKIFNTIDEELKAAKYSFKRNESRNIDL